MATLGIKLHFCLHVSNQNKRIAWKKLDQFIKFSVSVIKLVYRTGYQRTKGSKKISGPASVILKVTC